LLIDLSVGVSVFLGVIE